MFALSPTFFPPCKLNEVSKKTEFLKIQSGNRGGVDGNKLLVHLSMEIAHTKAGFYFELSNETALFSA